ncbi:MAG: thioredoxin-dependent thiol peroxidase [Chitinophagales bacterium]|nr:thioredoxin-dependent thiol peroxidase [Chitinophagales bacterium]MDW8418804.1 thioredoxin-dependent thiol peroxidase [Chitinophagales bacterium]
MNEKTNPLQSLFFTIDSKQVFSERVFKEKTMAELKEGDKAPAFTAKDQHGKKVSLKDFKGRKLVLYFYPKDDTPGCTAEACSFRDHYDELRAKGYEIVGVSPQGEASHKKFADKYSLPFALLQDEDHRLAESYGAWGEKVLYGKKYEGMHRITYLIDEKGVIERIIRKVDTKKAAEQILNM